MKEKLAKIAKNKILQLVLHMLLTVIIGISLFQYLPTFERLLLVYLIVICCLYELFLFWEEKLTMKLSKQIKELLDVTKEVNALNVDLIRICRTLIKIADKGE